MTKINISTRYRFLKSVLSFSKPQLSFQKIETPRILLSIAVNFGCSSYLNLWRFLQTSVCPRMHEGSVGQVGKLGKVGRQG